MFMRAWADSDPTVQHKGESKQVKGESKQQQAKGEAKQQRAQGTVVMNCCVVSEKGKG